MFLNFVLREVVPQIANENLLVVCVNNGVVPCSAIVPVVLAIIIVVSVVLTRTVLALLSVILCGWFWFYRFRLKTGLVWFPLNKETREKKLIII